MYVEFTAGIGPLEEAQGGIVSEIRRARSFVRPVTFLAVSAREVGTDTVEELTEEVRREGLDRYLRARVASIMSRELREYDILATRDGHIVSVLPETDAEQVEDIKKRIREICREELGVELDMGSSSFPDQEVTFDKLLKRAEADMRNEPSNRIVSVRDSTRVSKLAR